MENTPTTCTALVPCPHKVIEGLTECLKSLRKEALTLRALIRVVCDTCRNPKIAPLAEALGLDESSNKARRMTALAEITARIPYYLETRGPEGNLITTPARLVNKAEGVYQAAVENDAIRVLQAALENVSGRHTRVQNGVFYNEAGAEVDSKSAKAAAKAARAAAEEKKAEEKKAAALETLGIAGVKTLDTVSEIIQAAIARSTSKEVTDKLIEALALCK